MEPWQTVLIALGGNAAMLAALAYLAKSLIEHKLSRDVSKFQSELKAASDAAIERLKSDLQLHAIEPVAAGANVYEYGRFENVVRGARRRVCEVGALPWVHRSSKAALPRRRRLQEAGRKPFD